MALIANIHRKRGAKAFGANDFMPRWSGERSGKGMDWKALKAALGGKVE